MTNTKIFALASVTALVVLASSPSFAFESGFTSASSADNFTGPGSKEFANFPRSDRTGEPRLTAEERFSVFERPNASDQFTGPGSRSFAVHPSTGSANGEARLSSGELVELFDRPMGADTFTGAGS